MFRQADQYALRNISEKAYDSGIYYFNKSQWQRSCAFLKEAIEYLLKIPEKTYADYRRIIRIYYQLGNSNFNNNKYDEAIEAYQIGIKYYSCILSIIDDDYRQEIKMRINMCDSYLAINKVALAHLALLEAMQQFEKISQKNAEELQIKHVTHDPKSFYEYYEKRTSSRRFVQSDSHLKQSETLENYYHENRLNNIFNNMENININNTNSIKIKSDPMNEITSQLSQLSFLSNININNINDTEMREARYQPKK